MSDDALLVDDDDGLRTITINRPEVKNALTAAMRARFCELIDEADADDGTRAVIVTAVDPVFSAGVDFKEVAAGAGVAVATNPGATLRAATTPVVCAVNGACVTGALEIALSCTFVVASERARFADTHARVGVVPGWRLSVALPEAIGMRRAKEMSATGNFVDAATALNWGLVNHVVPHEELLPYCQQLGRDIASNDSVTARAIYSLYNDEAEMVDGPRATLELQRFHAWHAEGKSDAAEIERRRAEVVDRGRGQTR